MRVNTVIFECEKIVSGFDNVDSNRIRTHAKVYTNNNKTNLVRVCNSNILKKNNITNIMAEIRVMKIISKIENKLKQF